MPKVKPEEMMDETGDMGMMEEEAATDAGMAEEQLGGPEATQSAILLSVDDIPELRDLAIGDRVTLAIDTVNDDGTVGLSVFETMPMSEEAPEGSENIKPDGRKAIEAALTK